MIESFPSRCQEVREVDSLLGKLKALPLPGDWRLILLDPADGDFWEMPDDSGAQRVDEAVRSAVNSLAAQTCGGAGCVFVADGQGMPEPASVSLATLAAKAGVVACFGNELRAVLLMKDLPGSDIQHASLAALGMSLGTSLERLRLQDELELLGVVPRGVAHRLPARERRPGCHPSAHRTGPGIVLLRVSAGGVTQVRNWRHRPRPMA